METVFILWITENFGTCDETHLEDIYVERDDAMDDGEKMKSMDDTIVNFRVEEVLLKQRRTKQ
jgi:hypothetical protein